MMPSVEDIAIKNVVQIDIRAHLSDAIKRMVQSNIRNLVVTEHTENSTFYYTLTIEHLMDYKLNFVDEYITLDKLNLSKAKTLQKDTSILNVLNDVEANDKYTVILDDNILVGILSYTDIINNIDPKLLMNKQTLGGLILQYKATTTYKDTTTINAVKLMRETNNDAIVIIDNQNCPIGVFTTKDFIKLLDNNINMQLPIEKYMNHPIQTLDEHSTISQAIDFIQKKHFKRIIVTNNSNELLGLLTQKELLRIVYNKWIEFIQDQRNKMSKINEELLNKTSQLEKAASYDFLTNLYNRHKFDSILKKEIKKNKNTSLCILLIDIDHFKQVNDSFGHLVGDSILKQCAKLFTQACRKDDIVARWGGEEFIIMLPNTTLENSFFVAEKLRLSIEKHDFYEINNITCSIGVSQYRKDETIEKMFKRVDKALYKAKKTGRNKVEMEAKVKDI